MQADFHIFQQLKYTFDADHIWFTADTHFCHENIVRFSGRPFRNATEMN